MLGPAAPLLARIGRNATAFIAVSCLIGLVFPDLAAISRPTLTWLVFVLMALAFLQVSPADLARRLKRPARAIVADVWIVVALPMIALGIGTLFGLQESDPELLLMIFLVTAPTPLISAPTLAAIMGLDTALMLAVVLIAQMMVPLTAPAISALFVGPDLPLSVVDLALRLFAIVGVAFLVSSVVRRLAGPERIRRGRPLFDLLAVLFIVWFAIGAMDGLRAAIAENPLDMLFILSFAYAIAFAQMAITWLVFRRVFGPDAVAIAYASGNRNMGLLVAAIGVMALPDRVWYFFALAQLPIFTIPYLFKGLAARLSRPA